MPDKQKKSPKTIDDLCELMVLFRDEQQDMRSEMTDALKRLDELEKKVDGRMTLIESRQEELESAKCSKDELKETATSLREEIKEEKDKLSRKTNVVIFGIKEDEDGESLFNDLMRLVGNHIPTPYIERIGLPENSDSRPIRVCLPTMQAKRLLFKNCSKMKDREEFKKVRVNHDLTKKQIEAKRKLRSHSNNEKSAQPGENSKELDMSVDGASSNNQEDNEVNSDVDAEGPDPKKPRRD